ncbi:MSI2H protein, partial [Polyodon spathula]|nr:MSI2H protein [Polyodon spathula]
MFPPGTRGRARGLPYTMDAFMLGMGMLSYPNIVATYGRGYTGFAPSYSYQFPATDSLCDPEQVTEPLLCLSACPFQRPGFESSSLTMETIGFPATAYGPVAAAAVAAARGSGKGLCGRGGCTAYLQNAGPGFPDYGFYSSPSDHRGAPFSFADYASLGPQAAQMLQSEHAASSSNSPLHHLPSPDQFKNPVHARLIPSFYLCTPVLNSYTAHPNFGAPASPAGTNHVRPGGFPGANSPGPVADLYGTASQDSGVGNYMSAASPQPGSGFGHSIAVSTLVSFSFSFLHFCILFFKSRQCSLVCSYWEAVGHRCT